MALAPDKERPPQPVRWTREQYHQMGQLGWFDSMRVELIEGEIVDMSPVNPPHWATVGLVAEALRKVSHEGFVVREEGSLGLNTSAPEPDVAVIAGAFRDYTSASPGDAALIVEVADSSLTYDRSTKLRIYARNQIAEYWIVNLPESTLEVYRQPNPGEGAYDSAVVLRAGDSITPLSAPGSAIPVAELLP